MISLKKPDAVNTMGVSGRKPELLWIYMPWAGQTWPAKYGGGKWPDPEVNT